MPRWCRRWGCCRGWRIRGGGLRWVLRGRLAGLDLGEIVPVRGRHEGGCARRRRLLQRRHGSGARLFFCCRWDGGFDGFAAAGVEVEEGGDLVLGFRCGGGAESGGGGTGGTSYVGCGGDELEEVEGDVFGTTSGEVRALIHWARIAKNRE